MSYCSYNTSNLMMNLNYLYNSALYSAGNPFSSSSFYSTPRYDFSNNTYMNYNSGSLFNMPYMINSYYTPTYSYDNYYQPTYNLPILNYLETVGYGSYNQVFNSYPSYQYSYPSYNYSSSYYSNLSNSYSKYNNSNSKISGKNTKDISVWKKLGYNAQKGMQLAKNALNSAVGFTGYCARYVKNAIAKTGLGNYQAGDAYQMISIMRKNKNFKEINPNTVNVNNLPAGCVLVFDRGAQGYSGKYGHTEITDGNGRGISDGITNNLKKPTAIFMPVAA
ncbi:hypothetical protein HDR58_00315 [bacterium]|nr:hypothetical protein [bacterium]